MRGGVGSRRRFRADELDICSAAGLPAGDGQVPFSTRLANRRVVLLFVAAAPFHPANALVTPSVALYVQLPPRSILS